MPGLELKAYPTCTVIAEKFEALVRLDAQNTRMKDFFDLDFLLGAPEHNREATSAAILATFERRGSLLPRAAPTGLTHEFVREREMMWNAFLSKNGLEAQDFGAVVHRIRESLEWIWRP